MEAATARIQDFRHGRVPREVRERQLVELGEELFAERGFAKTSMDELARRAGVTKPVIYELLYEGRFSEAAANVRRRQAALILELMREIAPGDVDPRELEVAAHAVNSAYEGVAHWMWAHPDVPIEQVADWIAELLIPGLRRFT